MGEGGAVRGERWEREDEFTCCLAVSLQAKEGGFVVRNSSRENMYTLSIW